MFIKDGEVILNAFLIFCPFLCVSVLVKAKIRIRVEVQI